MKKLKLTIKDSNGAEILNRSQLKKVMGGNYAGSSAECDNECDIEGAECIIPTVQTKGICKSFIVGSCISRYCVEE